MNIKLYYNKAEDIKVNKTLDLELLGNVNGVLRQGTSILNPVIVMEISYDVIPNVNYAYIEEFKRYYFITDIKNVNNRLWEYSMKVDVLMSYSQYISSLGAYVERNEFTYNNLIEDKLLDFKYNKEIEYLDGLSYYTEFNVSPPIETYATRYCVLINAITNFQISAGLDNIQSGVGRLPQINSDATGDFISSNTYLLTIGGLFSLMNSIYNNDTIKSYIKNIVILPFELEVKDTELTSIYIGNETYEIVNGARIPRFPSYERIHHTQFNINVDNVSFIDYEPYTVYELFLPYNGYIKLNSNQVVNNFIDIYYSVSAENGEAVVFVTDGVTKDILYSSPCQLGVRVGLSSSNNLEVQNQRISLGISTALGAITSIASIVGGNPIGAVGGAISTVKTASNFIQTYEVGSTQVSSASGGIQLPQKAYIRITKSILINNDLEVFRKLYGSPLNEFRYFDEGISGFTKVSEVHIDYINATNSERNEIEQLLKSGIIL